MIRNLILLILLVPVLGLCGLYVAYGEVEPCKALAVEKARRGTLPTDIAEPILRMQTSQMSSTACVRDLVVSWGERLSEKD